MTEEEEKKEKEQQGQNNNILQKEMELWNERFGYSLREKNRILFNKMLSECQIKKNTVKL
jgi:hypothetical protein